MYFKTDKGEKEYKDEWYRPNIRENFEFSTNKQANKLWWGIVMIVIAAIVLYLGIQIKKWLDKSSLKK